MRQKARANQRRQVTLEEVTATLLLTAVLGLFAVCVFYFPKLYILATYEDMPGEWTQVFFFGATLVLAARLVWRSRHYRVFFALLALACFYVVGEEISWGQRLFALATPDFFQRHNLQQELNLHNLLTGPVVTWQKRAVEVVLVTGLLGYGLVYPLVRRSSNRLAGRLADHVPVPPLYLSPYFVVAALCEVRLFSFNEAEVAELLVGMALAFLSLHYYHLFAKEGGRLHIGRGLAIAMVGVVLASLGGAGTISWYCWQNAAIHQGIAKRFHNGNKKFAERYTRYGGWANAALLYETVLLKEPENRQFLRSLAACYKELGDDQAFVAASGKAVRLDMAFYGRHPRHVPVNLSLSKSFRLVGNQEKARFHLNQALAQSRDKVLLEPYHASNFYWYGKCLEANGDDVAARRQFARAVTMQPGSERFRLAYQLSRHSS
ncbi:MAG: hypothetical protein C0613_00795 [Desulfobulbaceae bacterium]|mgnify:CR=1 FL=1|nr:MAG: hypothetical protein C0613_00795 [Desulfobulbaceae bacterium]